MIRTVPHTAAVLCALLVVAMTWLPTVSTPSAATYAATIPVATLA